MKKACLIFFLCAHLFSVTSSAQTTDFRKESIYFLLVSRFNDGDSNNNRPNEWCSYIPGVNNPNITDPQDVTWRGDFKGLIEKLDYIWREAVRRNRWILDQGGERIKIFIRKAVGISCGCSSDTHRHPSATCEVCFGTGIIDGYDGPFDSIIAPDDAAAT